MKPREFWVDPESMDDEVGIYDTFDKHPGQGPIQWQASLIHVIEATPLTRNARELHEALKLAVILIEQGSHSYSLGKEAMDLIKTVLTKAEGGDENS